MIITFQLRTDVEHGSQRKGLNYCLTQYFPQIKKDLTLVDIF